MDTFRGYDSLTRRLRNPVVAIGNFDGVHRGHQSIFALVREQAAARAGESVVLTFEPHPVKVLAPEMAPALITTYARKLELIGACGIDAAVVQPFDRALAAMSADQFIQEALVRAIGARAVVVGYNFSFGHGRSGTPEMLRAAGAELGFEVTVVNPVSFEGLVVSSSKVREFVFEGRVDAATRVLGREFELSGVIVRGAGRGRTIGVPTANLQPEEELLPRGGVYVGHVRRRGARLPAVINVGINPTFVEGGAQTIEAHILDFDADLYGERLTFEFHQRLRAEQRFSGVAELVAQIKADIEQGREVCATEGSCDVSESDPLSDLDTLTMARVYLDQGQVEEAAAIYDRLVDHALGDSQQILDLREAVERSLAGAAAARRRASEPPPELQPGHGRDLVAVVPLGPGRLLCAWEATPRGRAAAAAQLPGRAGALALRLVTATPGAAPDGTAGRATRDLALDCEIGEVLLDAPVAGGFVCAAVGLLAADGAFAPVAHSEVLPLPATGPAAPAARVTLVEVEPARGGLDREPPVPRVVEP